MHRNTQGFSLLELMIVVAIIAILSTAAIPLYQNYVTRAKWTVNLTQLEPLKLSIAECLLNNGGQLDTCIDKSSLGLSVLPSPQHSGKPVTLSKTDNGLIITVLGDASVNNCHVEIIATLSNNQLRWTLKNIVDAAKPTCTSQSTGIKD